MTFLLLLVVSDVHRFVRIGKSGLTAPDYSKRLSSFVRIGKAAPFSDDRQDEVDKRASSFVRIGRVPSSAFVRIGRDPSGDDSAVPEGYEAFDRVARMGHSSFVRIGKREAGPEVMEEQAVEGTKQ